MRFAHARKKTRTFFNLVVQFLIAGFAFAGWHFCDVGIESIFRSCCGEVGSVSQIWLTIALKASPSSAKYAPRLSLVPHGDNRPNQFSAVNGNQEPKNFGHKLRRTNP